MMGRNVLVAIKFNCLCKGDINEVELVQIFFFTCYMFQIIDNVIRIIST